VIVNGREAALFSVCCAVLLAFAVALTAGVYAAVAAAAWAVSA